MIEAPLPPDEPARLRALHELGVLFTPAEERFDRITRFASHLLRVPIALISLVDTRVQWFKAAHGIAATETPRAISFCGHAIMADDTMVIPDALEDERFRDNPLVTGEPFVRFYAGRPLKAGDGSRVGTLCVIDSRPRQMSESDLETLRYLALWVEDELQMQALSAGQVALIAERDELARRGSLDSLTRAWNRGAIMDVLERELARVGREGLPLSVIMADVDHFKNVNDSFGHRAGDTVLLGGVRNLRATLRPYDAIGRFGGEEFMIVLPHCDRWGAQTIAERMRKRVEAERFETSSGQVAATLSLGVATTGAVAVPVAEALIEAADRALYQAKTAGRNRVALAD